MEPSDKREFLSTLNGMAALYGKELSNEQYEVYFRAVSDWPIDDFKQAAAHLMRACQFFPKPYDFEQLRKTQRLSAYEAWEVALGHAASGGWRKSSYVSDDGVNRAIHAIGGFQTLALAPETEHQFMCKKFMDAYSELSEVSEARTALPSFAENTRIGAPKTLGAVMGSITFDPLSDERDMKRYGVK